NDLSPPAVDVAVVERDERPQRAEGGGQRVADADPDPRRRPVRVAGDVAQPAHGLTDDTEPGPLAVRAGLAVARDADHDQLRVDLAEPIPAEPPALQRARPEVLHQDVGGGDQAPRDLLPLRLAQV